MIKITILLTRRGDLTHDEFIDYWTQKHTPLLAQLPSDEVTVNRYVQLQPTGDSIPGIATAPVDGVAELWVDSVADAAAWFTSQTYQTVVAEDEANFLDRSKTQFLYATEQVIFG
ncbi:EthD domain-containing protein [Nocardia sp. KC 131]|uniref:EthD domain-containing protein n=1 Tax=Nocardia arseniciresistens TaxID=3392119 RepID=UPI00398EFD31